MKKIKKERVYKTIKEIEDSFFPDFSCTNNKAKIKINGNQQSDNFNLNIKIDNLFRTHLNLKLEKKYN